MPPESKREKQGVKTEQKFMEEFDYVNIYNLIHLIWRDCLFDVRKYIL